MGLDPVIMFFLLGLVAGLLRADLRLPSAIYELLSVLLLLSIGLKGGMAMANVPASQLVGQLFAVAVMGLVTGLAAYGLLRMSRALPRSDAASIAAHYGSVSVGTYAVAVGYLNQRIGKITCLLPTYLKHAQRCSGVERHAGGAR